MSPSVRLLRRTAVAVTALSLTWVAAVSSVPARATAPSPTGDQPRGHHGARACPPAGTAVGFSDALDKVRVGDATVGGLSSLAYDRRRHAWASTVDNHADDPSRIWFLRDLSDPTLVGSPLILRRPDGTAYDGTTADHEGLAVLRDGRFAVSSETEPSIRIFGRDGVQQQELAVPARFAVTGTTAAGEATANATLEGLTVTPDGRQLVAAMEGALSGDVSATGDATLHRFLVYGRDRGGWTLHKQLAYRAEPGQRIPEVAAVRGHTLIVEEASFDPARGNVVQLFAVPAFSRARDVSGIDNLSTAPASSVLRKRLVADLVRCPTLGATSKQPQANPLLDNYEAMAVTGTRPGRRGHQVSLSLVSDDNFSATQITRVLRLDVRLPAHGSR